MVSRKQLALTAAVAATLGILAGGVSAQESARRFYPDDPLWREPSPRTVKGAQTRKVDDIYDFLENSYVTPRREGKEARKGPQAAANVNTVDEVPDSAWYANRHALRRMSIDELKRGPGNNRPPSPGGPWQIIGAKTDGVTPGFVIEDEHKHHYLLKFDPPRFPELCSAADVIGSKIFYALGYNTPENYVVHFRREDLAIKSGVMWRDSSGRKHPLTDRGVDEMLKSQPRGEDGTLRGLASLWIEGNVAGPFSYRGTRTDDPNDTVDHEDRRELRGLRVFAAWLNHHDTRSINSMDSLATENGVSYLKHYLLDFGSILGSDGVGPKPPWSGHQYTLTRKDTAVQMVTLGFHPPRWVRSDYPKLTGVGLFDSWSFDPISWKPNYPNPAFVLMDNADAFWAAKQVAAFTDDEIKALVDTGELSDPRAAAWITECLIKRRDKIAQAWFSRVLPIDKFRVVDGSLEFQSLGTNFGIAAVPYEVQWSSFDNRGHLSAIPGAHGRKVPMEADTQYLAGTVTCGGHPDGPCPGRVNVYLRRAATGFEVVGVDRSDGDR